MYKNALGSFGLESTQLDDNKNFNKTCILATEEHCKLFNYSMNISYTSYY